MISALIPYAVIAAILGVLLVALPLVGVLATAAALAAAGAGRGRR